MAVLGTDIEANDDQLVDSARRGDADALDALLKRYTSYARSKARTYFLVGADREDIVQEGMIGLFKAIRDFDADKTVSFRSFAELCITRQIITAIKTATRQKHTPLNSYVSLHRPVSSDDEGERQLSDFLASAAIVDPVDLVVAEDEVAQIRGFLSGILSDLEAEVLNMYLEGKSYQDIATSLSRQAKSIDNALQRIKRKLEHFLEQRERLAEAAIDSGRVVHVSRFTPQVAGGMFADGAVCDEPLVDAGLALNREEQPGRHAGKPSQKPAQKPAAVKPVPAAKRTTKPTASKASRTGRSAKQVARTTKPSAASARTASSRAGDLRAGLRYAVAAARARSTGRGKKRGR